MKDNNSLLWIQGKSVNEENIMLLNGQRISKNDDNYLDLYDKLVYKDYYKKVLTDGDNFVVYRGTKYTNKVQSKFYIIHSNYHQVDVIGRRVGFMARIENVENLSEAVDKLIEESKVYGYSCEASEIQLMKKKENAIDYNKLIILIISIIIILFILKKIL